jgi:hypothetical protein
MKPSSGFATFNIYLWYWEIWDTRWRRVDLVCKNCADEFCGALARVGFEKVKERGHTGIVYFTTACIDGL